MGYYGIRLKFLVIFLLIANLFAFTPAQKQDFRFSYNYGKKYDLGWTLVGISYVESSLGKYKINLADPSASSYHILVKSVLRREHIPDNSWNRSRMIEKLLNNKYFAARQAISELLFWKSYWIRQGYSGNWLWVRMVGSYNGGHVSNIQYARKVAKAIRLLRRYR